MQVDSEKWRRGWEVAAEGKIAPLRLMVLDVQMAPCEGKKRCVSTPTNADLCLSAPESCGSISVCMSLWCVSLVIVGLLGTHSCLPHGGDCSVACLLRT